MIGRGVARRYARALFEMGRDAGNLDRLEADLDLAATALREDEALRQVLFNPLIGVEEKTGLIQSAFAGRLSEAGLRFFQFLVQKGRQHHLDAVLTEFRRLVHAERGIMEAEALVAKPLGQALERDLVRRLEEVSGKRVALRVRVEPALLGGIVLQVGDRRIDGSVAGRLAALRQAMKEGRLGGDGPSPDKGKR